MNFWNSNELPLSLYFPVSINRTDYMNRYFTIGNLTDLSRYCRCIIKEIRSTAPEFDDYIIPSVTICAGTPSMLHASDDMIKVINNIHQCFHLDEKAEITYRLNPEISSDLSHTKSLLLPEKGRVELRLYSENEAECDAIHYPYRARDISATLEHLRASDTMTDCSAVILLGLPGQTIESFRKTLEFAVSCDFSELTIEFWNPEDKDLIREICAPDHRLYLKKLTAPDDSFLEEGLILANSLLKENGYQRLYDRVYAREGRESKISRIRMTNFNYLGLGSGASSFMGGNGYRNTEDLTLYEHMPDDFEHIACDFVMYEEKELIQKSILHMLGSRSGLSSENFLQIYPADPIRLFEKSFALMRENGYLISKDNTYYLTEKGLCHQSEVSSMLKE